MSNGFGGPSNPPSSPMNLRVQPGLTRFEVRARSLAGLADHTYVSCPDIDKIFTCFLMAGERDRLIAKSKGYYDLANQYRTPFVLTDTAGVNPYGVNGVCHQAANRFLLATSPRIQLNHSVGGYWLSAALFGVYGKDYTIWYHKVFLPEAEKMRLVPHKRKGRHFADIRVATVETKSAQQIKADKHLSENEIISNEACHLAKPIIHREKTEKIKEDIVDLLDEKDKVIDSGMRGEEMANKINELVADSTKLLASRLTDSEYGKLVGTQKGAEVLVVDPEIAAKYS